MPEIHSTAIVDPTAQLAPGVTLGPYTMVGPHCILGEGVELQPFSRLVSHVTLAEGVKLHSGAIVGDVPQHLGYKEHPGRVEIGKNTVLREGVTVHRPYAEGGVTRIGENCFLMANSHAAHDVTVGDRVVLVNGTLLAGHVTVGDACTLSGCALVHQWVKVGRLAMLSGGVEISCDIPPFAVARGRNQIVGMNVIGMRRAGMTPGQRGVLKRLFVELLQPGINFAQATAKARIHLETLPPDRTGPALELVNWLSLEHTRGVTRLPGRGEPIDELEHA